MCLFLAGQNFHLIADDAPPHVAHNVTTWLDNEETQVCPVPAQSPDLNLIENVWQMVQHKITSEIDNIRNASNSSWGWFI